MYLITLPFRPVICTFIKSLSKQALTYHMLRKKSSSKPQLKKKKQQKIKTLNKLPLQNSSPTSAVD